MKRPLAILILLLALPLSAAKLEKATFAGGCFWCMEPPFEKVRGVKSVWSGYTGGTVLNPTYEDVSAGGTGHKEAVQILYDPAQVTYAQLLDIFWRNIDPTDDTGQFCDKGDHYRSAIYYHNEDQRRLALASKQRITQHRVVTEIVPARPFTRAEAYHQDYYKKNPVRYKFYRFNCGRDARLESLWGKSDR